MAGPRQPTKLVLAKGKKHFTKQEVEDRLSEEVEPCTDEIAPPSYLTSPQKKQFNKIASQLVKIGIMGETDCDTLARYITAQSLYEQTVKDLRAVQKKKPRDMDPLEIIEWANMLEAMDKRQERYFKQAQASARTLGLTISDRCRLVVPKTEEKPPENKFSKFIGGKAAGHE